MSDRLFIIIPAYNEQENIRQVVTDWYEVITKYGDDSRLVVIDDGSRDSTYSILQDMEKTMPQLTALTKENAGHGATLMFGYKYALDNGADYVFQTDSDGQTLPSEFEPFWIARNKYDVSIGYRNKRRDGLSRVFVTKILRVLLLQAYSIIILVLVPLFKPYNQIYALSLSYRGHTEQHLNINYSYAS